MQRNIYLHIGKKNQPRRIKDNESKEELKRKLDILQEQIEEAEDNGSGPSKKQLDERKRLQRLIKEAKDI